MLAIDTLAWQIHHGPGDYTARVRARVTESTHVMLWFRVTLDRGRGSPARWAAERVSMKHLRGMPKPATLVGFGSSRTGAIRDALKQITIE